jgi:quinolinate synthase
MDLRGEIARLKAEQGAVILAHNYQPPEIQDLADFVGDSLGLSVQAAATDAGVIVFCGVDFMAESAKILSPAKKVYLPASSAKCPMAAMCDAPGVRKLKKKHPQAAVVSYVNTSAAVKAESDICCTSSNAIKVVASLPQEEIIFLPDCNLGDYVSRNVPGKRFILWPGFCPTHENVTREAVDKARAEHPHAKVLVHPECRPEVVQMADKVSSTEGMMKFAAASESREFIIVTECDMSYRLRLKNPGKTFYTIPGTVCPTMKRIRPQDILACLEGQVKDLVLDEEIVEKARIPLERMMAVGRGD